MNWLILLNPHLATQKSVENFTVYYDSTLFRDIMEITQRNSSNVKKWFLVENGMGGLVKK